MSRTSPLAAYGARIKELYIELDHYAFFHGPSEVDRIDRRFTGRQEVLERLKSLLTNHESPAGAYLVTGFRGAGKSSLVAKALAEITREKWGAIGARRALRIVSPVLFTALIPLAWWTGWIVSVPLFFALVVAVAVSTSTPSPSLDWRGRVVSIATVTVFLIEVAVLSQTPMATHRVTAGTLLLPALLAIIAAGAICGLVLTDPDRQDRLPAPRRRIWQERWKAVRRAGFLRRELPQASPFRTLVRDILAAAGLIFVSQGLFRFFAHVDAIFSPESTIHRLLIAGLASAAFVGTVPVVIAIRENPPSIRIHRFWQKLRKTLTSGGRVQVKINLSQDNLREIDILRSIASSLESEYRRFAQPTFWRLFIRCLLLLPFLLIATSVYNTTLEHWAKDVKEDLHIPCLFPSQGAYAFDESVSDEQIYRDVLDQHQHDRQFGSSNLRRILDQDLRDARRERGASQSHGLIHEGQDGLLGWLYETTFLITTEVDTLVQLVAKTILEDIARLFEPAFPGASDRPFVIDYGLVLFLVLGWIVPVRLMRWSLLDRPSHRDIVRQLRELNEMIDSEVTHEQGGVPFQATSLISLSFGRRQRQRYRHLNEREIEKRLIEILHHSQRVSPLEIRPQLIVVFDELDKIQHTPVALAAPSEEGSAAESQSGDTRMPELGPIDVIERNRQHRILSLVSNLKHFLSTAPAKFIFIAGREMFDAALADVSDRHFFMGSVFNEVLHVPSFHSDESDGRLPDITSLPEEVLCRFLLPRDFVGRPSLAAYRERLQSELLPDDPSSNWLMEQQRDKVMYELHNFVTYLTYRSNGAPKRITATLERFVVKLPSEIAQAEGGHEDRHYLVVGRCSRSLYLRFRYTDQYTFGLVTYLASPLIFSVNRAIKDYGDKILVSSAFVLDHIFKFHGHGFSWRNLELLPDVVDINRAPQLRELISHIMRFLSRGHINEIINGLYHYKFTRRISEEINFVSKLSEHESAAFNFTLDESLNLKRRFYSQLHNLLETHAGYPDSWSNDHDFINSVAFLRMILGDLHYYDGEYDSAIIEYMEAVQQLRRVRLDDRADTLVLMIRNFLKLGLAFERKKTFDSALVTYGRIATIVAEFGEQHIREGTPSSGQGTVDNRSSAPGSSSQARPDASEPSSHDRDSTTPRFDLDPVTIEGIRLIYQPMFARLQLIEKATLGGISFRDLTHVQKEFNTILGGAQGRERFLAASEFYNKVGDILFFKNGPMPTTDDIYCRQSRSLGQPRLRPIQLCFENPSHEDLSRNRRRMPCAACKSYNTALNRLRRDYLEIPLKRLQKPGDVLVAILESFEPTLVAKRAVPGRKNFLYELGDVLSDLGDTYVSCARLRRQPSDDTPIDAPEAKSTQPPTLPATAVGLLADLLKEDREPTLSRSAIMGAYVRSVQSLAGTDHVKIMEALAHFALAAVLFQKAAHHRAASIQVIKVLWLLREYLALVRPTSPGWSEDDIADLVHVCIRELHRSHEGTHRLEIERIKEALDSQLESRYTDKFKVDLGRLSINANITEILVLQREMRMLLAGSKKPSGLDDDICSPHAMFPSVYSRIHALRLRSSLHRHNLEVVGLDRALSDRMDANTTHSEESILEGITNGLERLQEVAHEITPKCSWDRTLLPGVELLEMMLIDATYCNHEIIRLMRIYGRSYMASHSMKAAAHDALSSWCNHIFAYTRYRHDRATPDQKAATDQGLSEFQEALEHAVGAADMVNISPSYHREMALLHWRSAAEAHSEGRAYKELLEDMFYLNDDFSDFLEHFCAALERLRLNADSIDDKIRKTTLALSNSSLYESKRYFDRSLRT